MNYLAHIFLSGTSPEIMLGNFMGDAVKGKQYSNFTIPIQKGILLHRQIDSFTDQHQIVKLSKQRLSSRFGHYRGVLIDIFYDHFLLKNWHIYSKEHLQVFLDNFYSILKTNHQQLPVEMQVIATRLTAKNGLMYYNTFEGLPQVFKGMEKRIKHAIPLHNGIEELKENYLDFENDFLEFFPLLINHSLVTLQKINKQYETK